MIKVGLVGFGFAAQTFHLPFLKVSSDFDVVAVSSRHPELVNAELPNARVYADYKLLLADPQVELVIITAPNHLHFSIAKAALECNKHVVIEKPMTTQVEDAQALIELADQQKRKLTVFHNRRWDGDFLTIKKLIASNELGEVKLFESHFDRFRPNVRQRWREQPGDGAGIWFDLGPHLVDQALQLFGLPESVTAKCLVVRENSEVCDYFHVQLHYLDKQVILNSSPYCPHPNRRFEVQGTKGAITITGLDPQEQQLKDALLPTDSTFGLNQRAQRANLFTEHESKEIEIERGQYFNFYLKLATAIFSDAPLPVDPSEIVDVIRLIQLAEKSSNESRTLNWY